MAHRAALLAASVWLALSAPGLALACSANAKPGDQVSGPVLAVPEDGVICLAQGKLPSSWVRVRLHGQAIDRKWLMAAVFGKRVDCVILAAGQGRCSLHGQDVSAVSRTPDVQRASLSWR